MILENGNGNPAGVKSAKWSRAGLEFQQENGLSGLGLEVKLLNRPGETRTNHSVPCSSLVALGTLSFVSSYSAASATTPSATRTDERRPSAAAARLISWHPPVSTGHSFSPLPLSHTLFQRSARGLYRPLPGMVSKSRISQCV